MSEHWKLRAKNRLLGYHIALVANVECVSLMLAGDLAQRCSAQWRRPQHLHIQHCNWHFNCTLTADALHSPRHRRARNRVLNIHWLTLLIKGDRNHASHGPQIRLRRCARANRCLVGLGGVWKIFTPPTNHTPPKHNQPSPTPRMRARIALQRKVTVWSTGGRDVCRASQCTFKSLI